MSRLSIRVKTPLLSLCCLMSGFAAVAQPASQHNLLLTASVACRVSVDGDLVGDLQPDGATKLTVAVGEHQVRADCPGFARWKKVILAQQEPRVVSIEPVATTAEPTKENSAVAAPAKQEQLKAPVPQTPALLYPPYATTLWQPSFSQSGAQGGLSADPLDPALQTSEQKKAMESLKATAKQLEQTRLMLERWNALDPQHRLNNQWQYPYLSPYPTGSAPLYFSSPRPLFSPLPTIKPIVIAPAPNGKN